MRAKLTDVFGYLGAVVALVLYRTGILQFFV